MEFFVALFHGGSTGRSCARCGGETQKPGDATQEAVVECEDRHVEGCEDGASCCNGCSQTSGLMIPVFPCMFMMTPK